MRIPLLTILMIAITGNLFSQAFFDFETPVLEDWQGDTNEFIVENGELRLDGPAATNESYISTQSTVLDSGEWRFSFRIDANPSSSNQAFVYLCSSSQELDQDLNGYYIKLGGTDDEVSLYRQNGNVHTEIIDGLDDLLNTDPASVAVKVTHLPNGLWTLETDTSNSNSFNTEGSIVDATVLTSSYFGILCDYTSTRSQLFYFDDINISGYGFVDSLAPAITNLYLQDTSNILISFSENIASVSGPNILFDGTNTYFQIPSKTELNDTLTIHFDSLCDIFDNCLIDYDTIITYYWPQKWDIVINEVFSDPTPSIGLPEDEFIELYNNSNSSIELEGWTISDPSKSTVLPEHLIEPGEYVILSNNHEYANYGKHILVNPPAINNSYETLILRNQLGQEIHHIEVYSEMHSSSFKKNGGWSLEQINPSLPCYRQNWTSSMNDIGGTPGTINSTFDTTLKDLSPPEILSVFPNNPTLLNITINEPLNLIGYSDLNSNGATSQVDSHSLTTFSNTDYLFYLSDSLYSNETYSLTLNVTDCENNDTTIQYEVGIPSIVSPGDLLFNEVLFNPESGQQDFIEVINVSNKILDVNQLKLSSMFEDGTLLTVREIDTKNRIIQPGEIIVFCEEPDELALSFDNVREGQLIETDLTALPDNEGGIILLDTFHNRIDQLYYYDDWHSILLEDDEGTSLERISIKTITQNESNWESASNDVNATPTLVNSQYSESLSLSSITLSSEHISPNLDGYLDNLYINLSLDKPGYSINISIYNDLGQKIKELYINELLGIETQLSWDGSNAFNEVVATGNYIILIELNSEYQRVERIKKVVTVVNK